MRKEWRVRYCPLDEEDRFGGTVTLVDADHLMDGLAEGRIVRVEGSLVEPDAAGVSPAYRPISVRPQ